MEQTLIRSPYNMLVLRSLDGSDHPLSDVTLVGREAECQLQLIEGHASRYHAKLTVTGPLQVLVEDLKSTNGTYVNGQRVETPIIASLGDELRFDTSRFRIATANSGGAIATVFRDRDIAPPPIKPAPAPKPQMMTPAPQQPQAEPEPLVPAFVPEPQEPPPMEIPAWAEIPFKPDPKTAAANARAASASAAAKPAFDAEADSNRTITGAGAAPKKPAADERGTTSRAKPKKVAQYHDEVAPPPGGTSSLPAEELANLASKSSRTVRRLESTNGPRLVVLNPPARGMIFPLADSGAVGEWLIGRGEDADVALTDRTVSSRHAVIRKTGNRWEIENQNATNGVFVNGKLISRRIITSGDKVRLGRTEMQFRTDNEPGTHVNNPVAPTPNSALTPTVLLALAGAVFVALFVLILILVLQRGP